MFVLARLKVRSCVVFCIFCVCVLHVGVCAGMCYSCCQFAVIVRYLVCCVSVNVAF